MPLISWNSSLEVGYRKIDEQHQILIDLLNRLNDAMRAGHSKEILKDVLNQLLNYTIYHFDTEEQLMARYHYSQSTAHQLEHQKFINDINLFQDRFEQDNSSISTELLHFLRNWLTHHIMQVDKILAKELNATIQKSIAT